MAADGVELAAAYISINARTDAIAGQIKSAFADAGSYGEAAGRQASAGMKAGLNGAADHAAEAGRKAGASWRARLEEKLAGKGWVQNALAADAESAGAAAGSKAGAGFLREYKTAGERASAIVGKTIGGGMKAGLGAVDLTEGLMKKAPAAGAALGKSIAGKMMSAARLSVAGAGVGGLLSAGGVAAAGFDRLKNIDQAEFKLKALGHTGSEVKTIMDSALAAVDKTAFGLGDAATASASAVAAGVKGNDLTQYLKDIGDAAAVAGSGFGEMESIFSRVQTNGKAMTDDLQMLSGRGLPIFQWLQKEYGVTGDELNKMVTRGQVDSEHFRKAIQDNIGGAAQKMGGSFSGSIDNLKAAIGRIGASFLEPLLGDSESKMGGVTNAIGALTEKLNGVNAWVKSHQGDIRGFFAGVAQVALGAAAQIAGGVGAILKTFGLLAGGVGNVMGTLLKGRAVISDLFGKHEDAAKAREAAESMFSLGEGIKNAGDMATNFGRSMLNAAGSVKSWGTQGVNSAGQLKTAMTGAIATVNGKDIVLKDNTPEVTKNLEELGVTVETLPEGEVKLVPNTPEAQAAVDEFIKANQPAAEQIITAVHADVAGAEAELQAFTRKWSNILFGDPDYASTPQPWEAQARSALNAAGYTDAGPLPNMDGAQPPRTGGLPAGVGGGGRGYMNYSRTSAYLDQVTGNSGGVKLRGAGKFIRSARSVGMAQAAQGRPYEYGGVGPGSTNAAGGAATSWDCSGLASSIWASAMGFDPSVRYFTTDSDFEKLGFKRGFKAGALNIGTSGGSGMNGHMAVTLPNGVNAESGGGGGTQYGGNAAGANNFAHQWYFDLAGFKDGGAVKGKGTRTSDSILALLSDDEHVFTADEVDAMGGHEGAYALRSALQNGRAADLLSPPDNSTSTPDQDVPADYGQEFVRSLGFIPASAGNTGVAGTSSLSGFINMGNSVVSGVIDTGVNLANTAVSAAIAGASMGAGAPASPAAGIAASYGTQAVGNLLKRTSSYGFQMAGIIADALMEQGSPFGAPRWLGYDYTSFMPQLGIQEAATSTLEKMGQDAISKAFPQPAPAVEQASSVPDNVVPPHQWDSMSAAEAAPQASSPLVGTLVTQDMHGAFRELDKVKRRDMMQYSGRG